MPRDSRPPQRRANHDSTRQSARRPSSSGAGRWTCFSEEHITTQAKRALARAYADELVARHRAVLGIILGGSVARGNSLPISDIDLWLYPREPGADLRLVKHNRDGVLLDVEQHDRDELRPLPSQDAIEPCVAAFLRDGIILHDPDGELAAAQQRYQRYFASDAYLEAVLPGLREPVERNLRECSANAHLQTPDALVAIRAPIFCLWSLVDLACVQRGVAPGGFRALARLRAAEPEAARSIEDVVCAPGLALGRVLLNELAEVYVSVAGEGAFCEALLLKIRWLADHGHLAGAWFVLWIAMGLCCKAVERGDVVGEEATTVRHAAARWQSALWPDSRELSGHAERLAGIVASLA